MDTTNESELNLFSAGEAERLHAKASGQLRKINEQRAALDREAGRLSKLVTALEDFTPQLAKPRVARVAIADIKSAGGVQGVTAVLMESGNWMSTQAITRDLQGHGWGKDSADPEAAVRANLRRLQERDPRLENRRVGRTVEYRLRIDRPLPLERGDSP